MNGNLWFRMLRITNYIRKQKKIWVKMTLVSKKSCIFTPNKLLT